MRYFFSWLSIAVYTLFIAVVSLLPLKQPARLDFPHVDKAEHFALYALFAYIVVSTFRLKKIKRPSLSGIAYIFCIGLALEAAQYFLVYRSFETTDILVNLAGGLASLPFIKTPHVCL
ncbi:MAG: VanZ family protein [Candidatus Omnitrophica bacterium]|nr:VanZ family protein [Candidatus Omnitrophota bacterium]